MKLLYWVDVAAFLAFGTYVLSEWVWDLRYLTGVGLAGSCFVLWMVARVQLGRSFSARARATRLVTTGLYARIRHPVYLFGGFAFAGLFIAWGNPFGLLYLLTVPVQVWRIRREEAVLERAFGEEYQRYKARTWF